MMEKHQAYFNLLDALMERCPICFMVKKTTHKLMDDFLYESVNDPGVRKGIKASSGFCNRHSWQLQKLGDGFGQAIIYSDLIETVLGQFQGVDTAVSIKGLGKQLKAREQSRKLCMFCKHESQVEERYISVFWGSIDDPEFISEYKKSFGLCLPHLSSALNESKDIKLGQALVDIETVKLTSLVKELKEFMRKHDYRFSKEGFGKEGDSWIRAIAKLIGEEGGVLNRNIKELYGS